MEGMKLVAYLPKKTPDGWGTRLVYRLRLVHIYFKVAFIYQSPPVVVKLAAQVEHTTLACDLSLK